jgi:hypothetical protein
MRGNILLVATKNSIISTGNGYHSSVEYTGNLPIIDFDTGI